MRKILLFIVTISCILSCARMGSPDGGWYDDTPPRVVGSSPTDKGTNVKTRRVAINFNEFIKLEDASNKVIISPPQLEMADIKASGKRIIIDLKDSLKANTTYTVDFSDAITDNNEGNPMGNYTFSFSTGEQIDTMEVSGYVLDASNLEPVKGILVGLYDNLSDTIFQKEPMMRVSRTNGSGRFTIKGVAPGTYRIYALQDADGDFIYGQKSETIAFFHDTITPSSKPDIRQDTVWRDSLHIDNILRIPFTHFLPDDITLLCFQAPQTDRFLLKTERKEPEKFGLFFTYGSDSLPQLRGLNFNIDASGLPLRPIDSLFVVEASQKRDTIYYWLRDTALVNQDTLRMEAIYMMTDTTGMLTQKTDTLEILSKISFAKRQKEQKKEYEDWKKEQDKKKKRGEKYDSIQHVDPMRPKISVSGSMDPNQNIYFTMPTPLMSCDSAAIHLYSKIDTLWYEAPFEFEQISTRIYKLTGEWRPEVEYSLEIDSAAFRDIYGLASGPIKQGLKVRNMDEYSSLVVNLSGVSDTVSIIVQLLDSSDKMVRQAKAEKNVAEFFFLKPAKYYLRAFVDSNDNGEWDTGNYQENLQPEAVYYSHEEVECKAKWDMTRDWNLTARPRYQQKPMAITKQKPDKAKQLRNRNAQRAAEKGLQYIEGVGVVKPKE